MLSLSLRVTLQSLQWRLRSVSSSCQGYLCCPEGLESPLGDLDLLRLGDRLPRDEYLGGVRVRDLWSLSP